MAKEIRVSDHDYDRLKLRAGSDVNIKFVVKNLLDLSDMAAKDIRKFDAWRKAVADTGADVPAIDPLKIPE
jgi:hypothetical protein